MVDTILVVNAGSSSIKFQMFEIIGDRRLQRRFKGQMDGIGSRPRLLAVGTKGETITNTSWAANEAKDVPAALDKVVSFLRSQLNGQLPSAIGHRVVHGGPDYGAPTILSQAVV